VVKTDADLFNQGLDIKQRDMEVSHRLMQHFGFEHYVVFGAGKPAILERINAIFRSFYRPQDLASGGHIGVFMCRDIFARIGIPVIFGSPKLDPFRYVELTPAQCLTIQQEPQELAIFMDQFTDVADIQYGISDLKRAFHGLELVGRFIGLSRLQLHAAAAILTGGYDFRGAVQCALLATELSLKAGAAGQGLTEPQIKTQFGHNLKALVDALNVAWPAFDADRVRRVITQQPSYVPNRYSAEQPARRVVGHTVMGAQYIASEVVRQLSDTHVRRAFNPPFSRHYPA